MPVASVKKSVRMRKKLKAFAETRQYDYTAYFRFYQLVRWYVDGRLHVPWRKEGYKLPGHEPLKDFGRRFFDHTKVCAYVYDKRTGKQCGVIHLTKQQMNVFLDVNTTEPTTPTAE